MVPSSRTVSVNKTNMLNLPHGILKLVRRQMIERK